MLENSYTESTAVYAMACGLHVNNLLHNHYKGGLVVCVYRNP